MLNIYSTISVLRFNIIYSFIGICFAFYASVVIPSIPLVVKPNLIGTAFGLTGVFQNTALALFPLITGKLLFVNKIRIVI